MAATRSQYTAPTEIDRWALPNDKGVLVEVGTSRLPIERQAAAAADVLWRLWGVDVTEGFTHDPRTARDVLKKSGQVFVGLISGSECRLPGSRRGCFNSQHALFWSSYIDIVDTGAGWSIPIV